jgi:hypothetical protein
MKINIDLKVITNYLKLLFKDVCHKYQFILLIFCVLLTLVIVIYNKRSLIISIKSIEHLDFFLY